ncbi:hypothetical protein DFH11DRAFT_1542630 [Phellopilus nigrolimitatus]|nr:hypothetical protein DFH11DRAFT_1542630 [Phellopilus nigrolimitatus]
MATRPFYQPVFHAPHAIPIQQPYGLSTRPTYEHRGELHTGTSQSLRTLLTARRASVVSPCPSSDGSEPDSNAWTDFVERRGSASSQISFELHSEPDDSFEDDTSDDETWSDEESVPGSDEEFEDTNSVSESESSDEEEPAETDRELMDSLIRYNKHIGKKFVDNLAAWFHTDYCRKVMEEVDVGVDPEKVKHKIRTSVLDDFDCWWENGPERLPEVGRAKVALIGQLVRVGIFDGSMVSALVDRYAEEAYRNGVMDVFKTLVDYAGVDICGPDYEEQTQIAVERLREVRDMLHNEWRTDTEIDRTFRQIESRVRMYILHYELKYDTDTDLDDDDDEEQYEYLGPQKGPFSMMDQRQSRG